MKLNHGEWHEFAHILLLIFNAYYTVFEACRQYFDQVFFEENVCILQGDFVICNGKSFPREYFKKAADIILNAPGKGSYEIPQIIPFLNETEIRKFKAASNQKADVYLRLADRKTIVGYSIKSGLAGNPTLVNSSAHTNFIYEITGPQVDADMINGISGGNKVIKRIDAIYETSELKFAGVQSESMAYNMQIIDSNFANVLAEILLNRFLMKTKSIKDIISKTQRIDQYQQKLNEFQIIRFLMATARGMVPGTKWDGENDADGGCLVLEKDGQIVGYDTEKKLSDYLYNTVFFDTPSTSRSKAFIVYEENNRQFFNLNMQIRMQA